VTLAGIADRALFASRTGSTAAVMVPPRR